MQYLAYGPRGTGPAPARPESRHEACDLGVPVSPSQGGPGEFACRLLRAREIASTGDRSRQAMVLHLAVLEHQVGRTTAAHVVKSAERASLPAAERRAQGRYPLLALDRLVGAVVSEIDRAVRALLAALPTGLPAALEQSGLHLIGATADERRRSVSGWLSGDGPPPPASAFWIVVAGAPPLELATRAVPGPAPGEWGRPACPWCGGTAWLSLLTDASGAQAGTARPCRRLVCGRCAGGWAYPLLACPACGERDPHRSRPYALSGQSWVRIDACEACHNYIKTFDLRADGAEGVVPFVDELVTGGLDRWAQERGLHRRGRLAS